MSTLSEMQFEILPSLTAEDGVKFGIGADVSVDQDGFRPPDDDWEDQDESNPRSGAVAFGRDVLQGPTWGWNLHIDRDDLDGALETLGIFKSAWRAKHIRNNPGAVIPIRYRVGNRYRRIFGRPRKFAAPPDNLILAGYIPVTVDFKAVDGYTYDDIETALELSLQNHSLGGFQFPLVFPYTTLPVGSQVGSTVVFGDAETYPVVRFNGPITNPSLEHDEWILSLDMEIADGDYVEVDLRPWRLTALLNGTASVAGAIGNDQYLSEMSLSPGPYTMTFRGASESSSATCQVRWACAHNSI